MTPFVILGLPRSRTFWTSVFLSYGGEVEHDPFLRFGCRDDVIRYFTAPGAAAVDTGLGAVWPGLTKTLPELRIAIIRRPVQDVIASLCRIGFDIPLLFDKLRSYQNSLDRLEASGVAEVFRFDRMDQEAECARLFTWALGIPFDRAWWQHYRDRNLQCDVRASMATLVTRQEQIGRMFQEMEAAA